MNPVCNARAFVHSCVRACVRPCVRSCLYAPALKKTCLNLYVVVQLMVVGGYMYRNR